jgi:hypothetical protein
MAVSSGYFSPVIAGLDPAIHRYEEDGCAGQARA